MKHHDFHEDYRERQVKSSSERSFGIVFGVVFAIVALWPLTVLVRHWDISPRRQLSGSIATKKADTLPSIRGLVSGAVGWSCHPGFKKIRLLGNKFKQGYLIVFLQELMLGLEKPIEFRIIFLKISSNHNV